MKTTLQIREAIKAKVNLARLSGDHDMVRIGEYIEMLLEDIEELIKEKSNDKPNN